jgi:hypothetical protein
VLGAVIWWWPDPAGADPVDNQQIRVRVASGNPASAIFVTNQTLDMCTYPEWRCGPAPIGVATHTCGSEQAEGLTGAEGNAWF